MGANRLTLIREITSLHILDNRYTNISVINCDPATGESKTNGGVLSVVFKADDLSTGLPVAIKFFDPDFGGPAGAYRQELFQRECDLIYRLKGNDRCIQLVQPTNQFNLTVTDPATGNSLTKEAYYFVVEWLDADINDYFLFQSNFTAFERLELLRDIVLAVFSLHNEEIYHRDLKSDNLRVANRGNGPCVVTIDLGTAASFSSAAIGSLNEYMTPVGAPAFAPLEAQCGLSGIRSLGVYTDVYALGCLLHDLFNIDLFYIRLVSDNGFQSCLGSSLSQMQLILAMGNTDEQKIIEHWDTLMALYKRQVNLPNIDGVGSTIPASVSSLLNQLLHSLTATDYKDRLTDLNSILRKIDSAKRILSNSKAEEYRVAEKRRRRQRKAEKIMYREKRLQHYLAQRNQEISKG